MNEYLSEVRKELDAIDKELIKLYLRRMEIAVSVAELKYKNGGKIFDEEREKAKIRSCSENLADENKAFAEEFMQYLMDKSKERQKEIISKLQNL